MGMATSVRLGVPESLGGIEEDYRRPDFATVIGLVLANKSLASGKVIYYGTTQVTGANQTITITV